MLWKVLHTAVAPILGSFAARSRAHSGAGPHGLPAARRVPPLLLLVGHDRRQPRG